MRNSFLKSKASLLRVPSGVKRFIATVADEMRDLVSSEERHSEFDSDREIVPLDKDAPLEEILPDEIREDTQRQVDALEIEAAEIAKWRAELDQILLDREERKLFFADFLRESEERFADRRQAAIEAVEGRRREPAPESKEASLTDHLADELPATSPEAAPVAEIEPALEEVLDLENYRLPSTQLLDLPDLKHAVLIDEDDLEIQKKALQDTLDSFAVDAFVYDAVVGPRITQFRVQPGVGVRVESISALQRNISLGLATTNIRIQAPIPGEPFVGIEVGNNNSFPVQLRSMLESKTWQEQEHDIPLVLGMDIQGKIIITDLAKAPHLLIAGATGSGKSVCMSNLILSLIYRFRPDELELVMVDPKRVEFGLFQDIPHLIHSVVTEPKQAVLVLKWVVKEMERRYEVLAGKQVRNIASYNQKADRDDFPRMPFMVVIIDELADLMMTSKGDAEDALARIAQLSRAVGIHTVIATQRPSVNVITGVIKANYPTRIAFQVSSNVDSRTILDCKGAESLLGKGDFLFNPPGIARLIRIQSPMVQDHEIMKVVEAVSAYGKARSTVDLKTVTPTEGSSDGMSVDGSGDIDEEEALFRKALLIIAESQKASTSYLQRRLRIGYNRAAVLIEEIEDRAYIGPQNGSTPREVFITPEDCEWCR